MNITLFTENIYKVKTKLPHKDILEQIKKVSWTKVPPQINYPSYNTNQLISHNNLLETMSLGKEIKETIDAHCMAAKQSFGYDQQSRMATSWANCIKPKNISEFHVHKNFWLSAVYYPHGTKQDHFSIVFKKNDPQYFDVIKSIDTTSNNNMCSVEVVEGDLIIFPSYLQHKIGYNSTNSNRYSIACNYIPVGTYGHSDGQINC